MFPFSGTDDQRVLCVKNPDGRIVVGQRAVHNRLQIPCVEQQIDGPHAHLGTANLIDIHGGADLKEKLVVLRVIQPIGIGDTLEILRLPLGRDKDIPLGSNEIAVCIGEHDVLQGWC